MKTFPILNNAECPSIPWELIEPHEKQAFRNHQQSLKRLAERGGLDPIEIVAVIDGHDFRWVISKDTLRKTAVKRLNELVTEWKQKNN